jgi:chemotaxis protein methyltransferase CheR
MLGGVIAPCRAQSATVRARGAIGEDTMSAIAEIPLTDREFTRLSALIYKQCGINLHGGKQQLVQARLAKRLRTGGFDSVSAYLDHVLADATGAELTSLIDSISTNLTSFFREVKHFDYLVQKFLPALIERKVKAGGDRRIRAWSAGCSTGEEPYSLAITLLDAVAGKGAWDIKLLATDISTKVLRSAQQGTYDTERVAPVSAAQKAKYFTRYRAAGVETYQAMPSLREIIRFRHLNLMEDWPFIGPFDFIFCRNVMIYFDKPTQERLVRRYFNCLPAGGMLFTGHSESLTGIAHDFRYVEPTIYARP